MSEEEAPVDDAKCITPEVLEENRRWIKLMNEASEQRRKNRDSSLYRNSSNKKLITPRFLDNY